VEEMKSIHCEILRTLMVSTGRTTQNVGFVIVKEEAIKFARD